MSNFVKNVKYFCPRQILNVKLNLNGKYSLARVTIALLFKETKEPGSAKKSTNLSMTRSQKKPNSPFCCSSNMSFSERKCAQRATQNRCEFLQLKIGTILLFHNYKISHEISSENFDFDFHQSLTVTVKPDVLIFPQPF